ncbi:MAG: hypothetical protein M0P77_05990 [Firmicutes bacterium]|nr:hypothetical protein [Bacillota bacterium]
MHNKSKLILFVINSGNKLEIAYAHSFFKKTCQRIGMLWNDSFFGKLISGFFNIDIHKSTFTYKLLKSLFDIFEQKIIKRFPLKEAVENSKYINNIKKILGNIGQYEACRIKTILSNSFFVKSVCEFWSSVD